MGRKKSGEFSETHRFPAIQFRPRTQVKRSLEVLAEEQNRTLSNMIETILLDYLRGIGKLLPDDAAPPEKS